MKLKDFFNEDEAVNVIIKQSLESASVDLESPEYINSYNERKNRYIPQVDYSKPENFAFYGSAEEYYKKSIEFIKNDYPYDGSLKEKIEWENKATYLDLYMFENEYPRFNGYGKFLRDGHGGASNVVTNKDGGYGLTRRTSPDYIYFKGGPNVDNVYDSINQREENLKFDFGRGVTVEFWAKAPPQPTSIANGSDGVVLFDVWNGENVSGSSYGRYSIGVNNNEISGSSYWYIHVNSGSNGALYFSGSAGRFDSWTASGSAENNWHHFAFTTFNSGSDLRFELFVDGQLEATSSTTGQALEPIIGSMVASLGASVTFPDWTVGDPLTIADAAGRGYGAFSGSLDEFRFWKIRRTAKQIGRNFRSQVGGGTNTDDSTVDLGVYFKFNEGIVGNDSQDAIVLDYSGRVSNGLWANYSEGARTTGSAIVESGVAPFEFKDPVIKSNHPDVISLQALKKVSGSLHDSQNNSMLLHNYPSWITEEDQESQGNLKILTQIMSSYFDTVQLQIQNLENIKTKSYISASVKPSPHSNRLLTSQGFVAPNIFVDAEILEQFADRNETKIFENNIHDIKNTIYQNIYNNIDYIFKSKGTNKSFRNLLRCYGINEDLIAINLYSNDSTHTLENNYDVVSKKKNYANFNDPDRNASIIYQSESMPVSTSGVRFAQTTECEVVFPRKAAPGRSGYYFYPFLSASLFGAMASGSSTSGSFRVYAVRDRIESNDVKFVLSSAFGTVSSSYYRNAYDNEKWVLALRCIPESPWGDDVTVRDKYKFELQGINSNFGEVQNQFTITSSIPSSSIDDVFQTKKRIYTGAAYTTISGTLLHRTDVKIGSVKHWLSNIDEYELIEHSKDPFNIGLKNPLENIGDTFESVGSVPKYKSLACAWDFQSGSIPDNSGMFTIPDFSSGSAVAQTQYGVIGAIAGKQYNGVGRYYLENDSGSIEVDYVSMLETKLPESLNSLDMISIGEEQDKIFTKDSRPIDYFWAFEKSLSQTVSKEILNFFAGVKNFNNLIGEPVNRYRQEYKSMQKARQLFFEKFENEIDFEKYLNYFKWLDSSINMMLGKLIPISANTSERLRNVVESHVLERHKVWNKYPTLEMKQDEPFGTTAGNGEKFYKWKFGHAPLTVLEDDNRLWWISRIDRNNLSTGDSQLDAKREILKDTIYTNTSSSFGIKYDISTNQKYQSSNFFNRNAQQYKISGEVTRIANQKDDLFLETTVKNGSASLDRQSESFKNYVETEELPLELQNKKKISVGGNRVSTSNGLKLDQKVMPFANYSGSYLTDNAPAIQNYQTPLNKSLQSPFVERFVGGHKANYQEIGTVERIEKFILDADAGILTFNKPLDGDPYDLVRREEFSQRAYNTKNIKFTTTSANQIGNYQQDYEVFQTSGRTENNRWFVENNGVLSASSGESTVFSGSIEFPLPDRGSDKHVFVVRFSAPGDPSTMSRGFLDVVAEELSPYNNINYRNMTIRQPRNTLLRSYCLQNGNDSERTGSACYHKFPRNGQVRLELSGNTVISGTIYDNGFISHQIPRSDLQYMWINNSSKTFSLSGEPDIK